MFRNAMGRKQAAMVTDPLMKKGIGLWLERVLAFYGESGGVDVEVIEDQLILNEKTQAHIYSTFTPDTLHYKAGSRPFLEEVVRECVTSRMSPREKALALMRRCRDNRDRGLAKPSLFYGGTEEELLKRGASMCNEISRVYACLCQIAGLPCRLFCAHISGHMMNEVQVEGRWWWLDVMKGMAPVNGKDEPVSAWDLHRNPARLDAQPRHVIEDCRPVELIFGNKERDRRNIAFCFAKARNCYFHPREALAVGNYFVWDHHRYTYPWIIDPKDPQRRKRVVIAEQQNRKAMGWPDYYFSPVLFDPSKKG